MSSELLDSGTCRATVRHPIYGRLFLAIIGSAVAGGEWRGVLSAALAFVVYWQKLRTEERWMREQFGGEYEAYSSRVAALIPFVV